MYVRTYVCMCIYIYIYTYHQLSAIRGTSLLNVWGWVGGSYSISNVQFPLKFRRESHRCAETCDLSSKSVNEHHGALSLSLSLSRIAVDDGRVATTTTTTATTTTTTTTTTDTNDKTAASTTR